jgi:nanoRNase/pAp phosphatase (c-di-AMP/oligoRNAs hydrolase)
MGSFMYFRSTTDVFNYRINPGPLHRRIKAVCFLDMNGPFAKSVSTAEKCKRLQEAAGSEDTLAILIHADPDSIASAFALKRFFWRKVKRVHIVRVNKIERADNLAFVNLLNLKQQHVRNFKSSDVTKWAIVDSQPNHHDEFNKVRFDIIIDHHPVSNYIQAPYVDIQQNYGANSTILTEYLKASKIKPSPRLATALFYGIKTDTNSFVRSTVSNDIKAFRYLYEYANLNIIKKIESSEMTKKTLSSFKVALDKLSFVKRTAVVHMGEVEDAATLVIMADFFMKMAEATCSIVSGILDHKLIVIFRNAGFRRDAGKLASEMFGHVGSAGGHKNMARAEIPLAQIKQNAKKVTDLEHYVLNRLRRAGNN